MTRHWLRLDVITIVVGLRVSYTIRYSVIANDNQLQRQGSQGYLDDQSVEVVAWRILASRQGPADDYARYFISR